jgi:GNAT superfamily N-acetyltransferase
MLSIKPLCQAPELLSTVSGWLAAEWPGWYGPGGPGNVMADVHAFARSESEIPIGFVVFRDSVPVGFCALKAESIPTHTHLTPWIAAAFVLPGLRGAGIGAFMVRSVVAHARRLGHGQVYSGTSTAVTLLQREGWDLLEEITHAGVPLLVFRRATATWSPSPACQIAAALSDSGRTRDVALEGSKSMQRPFRTASGSSPTGSDQGRENPAQASATGGHGTGHRARSQP